MKAKHETLYSLGEALDEAEIEAIRDFEKDNEDKRKEVIGEGSLAQTSGQTQKIFAIPLAIPVVGIPLSGMSILVTQK